MRDGVLLGLLGELEARIREGDVDDGRRPVRRDDADAVREAEERAAELGLLGARLELRAIGVDGRLLLLEGLRLRIQLGLLRVERGDLRGRRTCGLGLLPRGGELLLACVELRLPCVELLLRGVELGAARGDLGGAAGELAAWSARCWVTAKGSTTRATPGRSPALVARAEIACSCAAVKAEPSVVR